MVEQEYSIFRFKVNYLYFYFYLNYKKEHFMLDNPDWKYDVVPEIMDGKNIGDFVDADIL